MAVKMPVLGQQSRRRSSGLGWVLFLAARSRGGWIPLAPPAASCPARWPRCRWSRRRRWYQRARIDRDSPGWRRPRWPPPVPTGPRFLSARDRWSARGGAGRRGAATDTGPALTQVVKRVLVWWMAVPRTSGRAICSRWCTSRSRAGAAGRARCGCRARSAGRTFEAYRFKPAGAQFARFYDAGRDDLELRLEPSPLDSWEQITSLLKDGRKHKGVDFKTPVGTPVKATFDGTITRKNWFFRGNGNSLEVTEAGAPHT